MPSTTGIDEFFVVGIECNPSTPIRSPMLHHGRGFECISCTAQSTARRRNVLVSGRRYYSSSHGRFLGRDPIEEKGGLNLYLFCRNNCVNSWDVLGMAEDPILVKDLDGAGGYFGFELATAKIAQMKKSAQDRVSVGPTDPEPINWSQFINIGPVKASLKDTNALKFDGSNGTVLVVYSSHELGSLGNASGVADLDDSSKGVVRTLNLDDIPKGADIGNYIKSRFGDASFNNIVYEAHVGYNGEPKSPQLFQSYGAGSSLNSALSSYMGDGGKLWLNWCFGASYAAANPNYLSDLSKAFRGADVYYGSGVQAITTTGIESHTLEGINPNGDYVWSSNRNLDYQVFTGKPPKG